MLSNRLSIIAGVMMLVILSNTAIAQSNFYVFGSIGDTSFDVSFDAQNRLDADHVSYEFGAGYVVNRNLSIEVGYHDFGNQNARTTCPPGYSCIELVLPLMTKADTTAYSLSVVGNIPLTDRFDAFGKVGIASWDVDYEGISSAFNSSGEDMHYGAGLRWSMGDHLKVSAEYRKVELGVDMVGIGVSYYF